MFEKKNHTVDPTERQFQKNKTLTMKIGDTEKEGITANVREMIRNEMSMLRKELEDKIV